MAHPKLIRAGQSKNDNQFGLMLEARVRYLLRVGTVILAFGVAVLKPAIGTPIPTAGSGPQSPAPAIVPVPTAGTTPPLGRPSQHTITIQSSDGIQITPRETKEWYQEGPWPLVGSVAVILLTNTIAIGLVYLQSFRSFRALLRQRKVEILSSSLNDFYNPLLALIDINGEIFEKTGPSTFPEEHIKREAAGLVWKEIKKKIVENNREIEKILKTKTHLMHKSDSLVVYKALLVHVAMYETFQKIETDRYSKFQFPKDVRNHIVSQRRSVLKEFQALSGESA